MTMRGTPSIQNKSTVIEDPVRSAFQQNRASLWKALAPKPFEIKTWDWSRLKDFFKIFKNV